MAAKIVKYFNIYIKEKKNVIFLWGFVRLSERSEESRTI